MTTETFGSSKRDLLTKGAIYAGVRGGYEVSVNSEKMSSIELMTRWIDRVFRRSYSATQRGADNV